MLILIGEDEILVDVSDAISVELDSEALDDDVSVSDANELETDELDDDGSVSVSYELDLDEIDDNVSDPLDDIVPNVSNVSIVPDDFVELLRIEDDVLFLVLPLCLIVIFGGISLIY
jgi:hypothetical protein